MGKIKSVIQKDFNSCLVCESTRNLHRHHVFGGSNRPISDRLGYVVRLCYEHHEGETGVHKNPGGELDRLLKKIAQEHYEKNVGSREEFIRVFGKSWL